jgi:alpha-beta hydrolase superfamily lysophospholipase
MQAIKSVEIKAKDGHALQGDTWGDLSQAKAIIVVVHGLGEHVSRFTWRTAPKTRSAQFQGHRNSSPSSAAT